MPGLMKRKTSHVAPSGFELYTGDDPRPGGYRAVVKQMHVVKSKNDNLMFNAVVELHAKPGSDKAKYDGWAGFPMIVLTEVEANIQREQALYLAICGKPDTDTKTDVDPSKFVKGDGQKAKVLTIGGVNPIGKIVNARLTTQAGLDGVNRIVCDSLFRARDEEGSSTDTSSIEDDIDDIETEDVVMYEEEELKALSLPALRKLLVDEFEMDAAEAKAIKSKAALVAAILEAQEEALDDDESDEEDEEAEEDEDDAEEDEEDDEEDEEEDDEDATLEMDRAALKAEIKKRKPTQKITVKMTDDDLRDILRPLLAEDPPF